MGSHPQEEWEQEVANDDAALNPRFPRCPACKKSLVQSSETVPGTGKHKHGIFCLNPECIDICRDGGEGDTPANAYADLLRQYRGWVSQEQNAGEEHGL